MNRQVALPVSLWPRPLPPVSTALPFISPHNRFSLESRSHKSQSWIATPVADLKARRAIFKETENGFKIKHECLARRFFPRKMCNEVEQRKKSDINMILRYLTVCLFSHHSSSVVQMTIKLLYFHCSLCEIGQEACAGFYGDKDTKKTTVSFLVSNICTKSRSTGLQWPSTWSCWVFPGFCPDITADTRKM